MKFQLVPLKPIKLVDNYKPMPLGKFNPKNRTPKHYEYKFKHTVRGGIDSMYSDVVPNNGFYNPFKTVHNFQPVKFGFSDRKDKYTGFQGFESFRSVKPVKEWKERKDMNYSDAYDMYRLNPFGDADKDRVPNWRDCKPYDRTRDGKLWDSFKEKVSGVFGGGEASPPQTPPSPPPTTEYPDPTAWTMDSEAGPGGPEPSIFEEIPATEEAQQQQDVMSQYAEEQPESPEEPKKQTFFGKMKGQIEENYAKRKELKQWKASEHVDEPFYIYFRGKDSRTWEVGDAGINNVAMATQRANELKKSSIIADVKIDQRPPDIMIPALNRLVVQQRFMGEKKDIVDRFKKNTIESENFEHEFTKLRKKAKQYGADAPPSLKAMMKKYKTTGIVGMSGSSGDDDWSGGSSSSWGGKRDRGPEAPTWANTKKSRGTGYTFPTLTKEQLGMKGPSKVGGVRPRRPTGKKGFRTTQYPQDYQEQEYQEQGYEEAY